MNSSAKVKKNCVASTEREEGREGGGSSKLKLFPSKVPDTKVAFTKTFDIAS